MYYLLIGILRGFIFFSAIGEFIDFPVNFPYLFFFLLCVCDPYLIFLSAEKLLNKAICSEILPYIESNKVMQ
uniref:Uncharacterized protein n=1 Tax=Lutzomyia longipalpis TaxID=7200 RepID=A0A7G3B885_LUTLO